MYVLGCSVVSHSETPWAVCSPPGSSVHGDSPGENTGVGCHALLQGIFPSQGLSPGLPRCRRILYHLSHREAPQNNTIAQKIPMLIYCFMYNVINSETYYIHI